MNFETILIKIESISLQKNNLNKNSQNNRFVKPAVFTVIMNLEITISDSFNVVLLVVGLNLMYRGLEISHPVFGVLFCNLFVALSTSITEILTVETVSNIRVTTIAGCFTAALVHFHCCCCTGAFYQFCAIFTSFILTGSSVDVLNLTEFC